MAEQYEDTIFPPGSIQHAAETGNVDKIKALEAEGRSLHGYPEAVTLQRRDDVLGAMAIHVAAERGQAKVIKYLISKFVDLDVGDNFMVTPLHLAAIKGHLDVVKMLLNAGANLSRQDSEGDQPLHWAATKLHTEIMELLLERGASIDAHNKAGWTALHRAAFNGRDDACRLLVRRGAGLHAITTDGCTPLHLAAKNNHLGVMHQLTSEFGARVDFCNSNNQTPQDCCITDGARQLLAQAAAQQRGKSSAVSKAAASTNGPSKGREAGKAPVPAASAVAQRAVPRNRPAHNARLDQDGFPVASVDAAAHELAWQGDEEAGQPLQGYSMRQSDPAEQLAAMMAASTVAQQARSPAVSGGGARRTSIGAGGPHAGRAAAASVGGALSVRGGELVSPWSTDFDRMSEASVKSMAPRPSANKKFLDSYQLNKMGLFNA